MGPLLFVNWHAVNVRFRALMWIFALILAVVVLADSLRSSERPSHQVRGASTLPSGIRGKP